MEENNTIRAYHGYVKKKNGEYLYYPKSKLYTWHIPKAMRKYHIKQGDLVFIRNETGGIEMVYVEEVFRENIEETGKRYKTIISRPPRGNVKKAR